MTRKVEIEHSAGTTSVCGIVRYMTKIKIKIITKHISTTFTNEGDKLCVELLDM
ncbi:MAG TPA: hypothetical protein IAB58_02470 [Candidatus Pelethosoma merdigallinarum]|nr:hypothetical protein [Candidatus Pelethosoma merdigallinarum]